METDTNLRSVKKRLFSELWNIDKGIIYGNVQKKAQELWDFIHRANQALLDSDDDLQLIDRPPYVPFELVDKENALERISEEKIDAGVGKSKFSNEQIKVDILDLQYDRLRDSPDRVFIERYSRLYHGDLFFFVDHKSLKTFIKDLKKQVDYKDQGRT